MQKLLFTLFVFTTWFGVKAQTNVYHPFPDSNAVWSNYEVDWFCPGYCAVQSCTSNYQYRMKGDTIISGIKYNKIYKQGMWSYGQIDSISAGGYYYSECLSPVYSSYYNGGIRNDILHKKVFYYPPSSSGETLMYDFSLAVWDTMRSSVTSFSPLVITNIDSILVNGSYRKRFNFNGANAGFVEGIGNVSLGGTNSGDLFIFGAGEYTSWNFICFWQNDTFMYGDSNCSEISSIKEVVKNQNEVVVFPNPNNGSFIIEPSSATKQTMQVYDVNGKLVLNQTLHGKTSIDASNLNEGIYNISIINNEGLVNKRLVITHP